jgi:hypothetical protein
MTTTFGDVRSLLYQTPTEERWELLCELLEELADSGVEAEPLCHYAEAQLERWPVALRVMPTRWLNRLLVGQRAEFVSLVRVVSLRRRRLSDEQLIGLAHSGALATVEVLELRDAIRDSALDMLMDSPQLGRLTTLRLPNNALGRAGEVDPLRWLETAMCVPVLERLGLGFNRLGDAGAEQLAQCARLANLRELELYGNEIQRVEPLFTGRLERLERLDLKWNTASDLDDALGGGGLPELRVLGLSQTGLTSRGLRALAEGQAMPRLESLRLGGNPGVTDAGLQALAGARWLVGLRELNLLHTSVHSAGVIALIESGRLERLERLWLPRPPDRALLEALTRPGAAPALVELHAQVGAEGRAVLARAGWREVARALYVRALEAQPLT